MELDSGHVTIKQGVPYRNGVWKHKVLDGPNNSATAILGYSGTITEVPLECAIPVDMGVPLVGERGDCFVVSLRMSLKRSKNSYLTSHGQSTRRTGYNELWSALWGTRKTDHCSHTPHSGDKILLEPGWVVVSGYENHGAFENNGRLIICLTAFDPVARWRALIGIREHSIRESYQVLLRTVDCCLQCAIDQALKRPGRWYLVL